MTAHDQADQHETRQRPDDAGARLIHRPRRTERDPTEGAQTITATGVRATSGS